MILLGHMFGGGIWEKLTKEERKEMDRRFWKLQMIGLTLKHYHLRKIGDDIILAFSSNKILWKCEGVEWMVQFSANFVSGNQGNANAKPKAFVLTPDLDKFGMYDLRDYFRREKVELTAFYHGAIYKAEVLKNGQLCMSRR